MSDADEVAAACVTTTTTTTTTTIATSVDDGCNAARNTRQCAYDDGMCCRDTCLGRPACEGGIVERRWDRCKDPSSAQLASCGALSVARLGDGTCDPLPPYNSAECNYDGGDCCAPQQQQQEGEGGTSSSFSSSFPHCKNPAFLVSTDGVPCRLEESQRIFLGDGWCDDDDDGNGNVTSFNSAACRYDGGDCCQETCVGLLCGQNGWSCRDPSRSTDTSGNQNNTSGNQNNLRRAAQETAPLLQATSKVRRSDVANPNPYLKPNLNPHPNLHPHPSPYALHPLPFTPHPQP